MFVAIVGTPCSGKRSVLDYFLNKDFTHVTVGQESLSASETEPSVATTSATTTSAATTAKSGVAQKFPFSSDLLDFATRTWRSNFVTTSLRTGKDIEAFSRRPFFLLVAVDAPAMTRWWRHTLKTPNAVGNPTQLEDFVAESDMRVYGHTADPNGAATGSLHDTLKSVRHVSVLNHYSTHEDLYRHLDSLDLRNEERLRPSWDSYFMTLSELAAQRCNCMKRRVGAILVRNNRIVATGYNGTPRGLKNCNEGGCPRCNGEARSGQALDECLCLHAEENALLEAGRERVGDGAVLYCNTCPCLRCAVKIIQTGVKEVVYNFAYSMDEATARVLKEAGVRLRQHSPPTT